MFNYMQKRFQQRYLEVILITFYVTEFGLLVMLKYNHLYWEITTAHLNKIDFAPTP